MDFQNAEDKQYLENEFLNAQFTEGEVSAVIDNLNNNKSAGLDKLINEFFKYGKSYLCPVVTKLFNVVLNSGIFPESWAKGLIVQVYENKGDRSDPNNYRGITLISCVCKMFTSLISCRISKYVENFQILGNEQAGFRKKFSTVDHVFLLHTLIMIYSKVLKNKLFCCFVDYKKAFDSVAKVHLWSKLLSYDINGKVLNIIKSLYNSAKSAVKLSTNIGAFFNCEIGVSQGDNLSPLLFALFLMIFKNFSPKHIMVYGRHLSWWNILFKMKILWCISSYLLFCMLMTQ